MAESLWGGRFEKEMDDKAAAEDDEEESIEVVVEKSED